MRGVDAWLNARDHESVAASEYKRPSSGSARFAGMLFTDWLVRMV